MKKLMAVAMLCALPALAGPVDDARVLMDEGRHREAADLLAAKLDQASPRAEALILLTTALNSVGDYKKGVEYGEQAVEAAPKSSEAHLQYARALRIKMQNHKVKAMFIVGTYKKELQKAIELDPNNVEAREEEIGYLSQAPSVAGGDKDKALERIEDLKAIDWRQAMFMQAGLRRAEEDPDAALAIYEEMLQRDPNDYQARHALAYLLQAQQRYTEADKQFVMLLEGDNERLAMSARYQLARSRILGEYEQQKAVAYLLDYIAKPTDEMRGLPTKSHAYWRLGLAYEQLDRVPEARRSLEKAVALDDENKEAKQALKSLNKG